MLNTRSLTHPTMIRKIDVAMREAAKQSKTVKIGHGRVDNRDGNAVMTLRYHRGEANAFQFWRGNQNITDIVLAALRSYEWVALIGCHAEWRTSDVDDADECNDYCDQFERGCAA